MYHSCLMLACGTQDIVSQRVLDALSTKPCHVGSEASQGKIKAEREGVREGLNFYPLHLMSLIAQMTHEFPMSQLP